MSRGPGTLMREVAKHLTRAHKQGRDYVNTVELVSLLFPKTATKARAYAVRRALASLERRGNVLGLPGRPRRWALIKGWRPKKKSEEPSEQMDLFEGRACGTLNRPRGDILWD